MNFKDELEIQKISICYAWGVDSLGNYRDMEKALEYLRKGFTEDCIFEFYWRDGSLFSRNQGLPDFAKFALGFMTDKEYTSTQHLVSNILVEIVENGTATAQSYVQARHMKPDNSQDVAIANYVDKVIREDGNWKCCERKCTQLSFDNFSPEYSLLSPNGS